MFETESEAATGENGPPTGPVLLNPFADTASTGAPVMVKVTFRDALPSPLVVLLKIIVSVLVDAANVFALAFTDTVNLALAPPAKVPELGESVSHETVFAAVQLRL